MSSRIWGSDEKVLWGVRPNTQLPSSQHRHERPHCGTRVLLRACFISLKVANTGQLSLSSLRDTVVFSLSSRRLYCSYIAISPQSKLSWQGLNPMLRPGGSWGCCEQWSAMLVQRLKVLPPSVECSAGPFAWGALQKGEEERGGDPERKRKGGRWPLNSAIRKLWFNFLLW